MKKITSILLAVCVMLSMLTVIPAASTGTGTLGSITWTVDGTTLTISPTDTTPVSMPSNCWNAPWHTYSRKITHVVVSPGVTSVGTYAFYEFTALESADLADDVTSIGQSAFYGCTALTDITLSENLGYVYYNAFTDVK